MLARKKTVDYGCCCIVVGSHHHTNYSFLFSPGKKNENLLVISSSKSEKEKNERNGRYVNRCSHCILLQCGRLAFQFISEVNRW